MNSAITTTVDVRKCGCSVNTIICWFIAATRMKKVPNLIFGNQVGLNLLKMLSEYFTLLT